MMSLSLSLLVLIIFSQFFDSIHSSAIPSTTYIQFPQSELNFDSSIPYAAYIHNNNLDKTILLRKRQVIPIVDLTPEQNAIKQTMASGKSTSFNDTELPKGSEKDAKLQAEKEANMTSSSSNNGGISAAKPKPTSQCDSLATRRPWSQASHEDRKSYLDAATCVGFMPGTWNQRNFTSTLVRDDFVLYHAIMTNLLHFNAHLFPCHRLLVNTWFSLLQTKCNYTGDLLYMDFWTYADNGTLWTTDDIWSSDLYGKNIGPLVEDGNEKDVRVHFINVKLYGVDIRQVDRPIRRRLTERDSETNITFQDYMTTAYLNACLQATTYDQLRRRVESTAHAYLHRGVGGDMIKTHSVVDDFFWAIHTGLDAVWAFYQDQDDGKNRFAFGGPRVLGHPEQATLHDTCTMLGVWSPDYNVLDLMDIRTKPNCFNYQYNTNFTDS